jgi:hypothetical protein
MPRHIDLTRSLAIITLGALLVGCGRDSTSPTAGLAPRHAAFLINPSGTVVVTPFNMRGWVLVDDQHDSACTDATVCRFVSGPGAAPDGTGSAELATPSAGDGYALILPDYAGTRLDAITTLNYWTYRQSADAGNNLAIALQFNVDYDLADEATGFVGRLVFEPYQGNSGTVVQNQWQSWNGGQSRASRKRVPACRIPVFRQRHAPGPSFLRPSRTSVSARPKAQSSSRQGRTGPASEGMSTSSRSV